MILLTGGSGFLGRFILEKIEDAVVLDLREPYRGEFEFGSVTSWPDIVNVIRKYDIDGIIHAAAELSVRAEKSPMDAFRINVGGTLNVLEACRIFDIGKVVFISSHSVYGPRTQQPPTEFSFRDPTSFYGATKACSEIIGTYYSYAHGIDFRAVRLPIVAGPFRSGMGASVIFSSFIDDLFAGKKPVITLPPETKLPLLYVRDAAELVVRLYRAERVSKPIFNGGGIAVSLQEMVEEAKKYFPDFAPDFQVNAEAERIASVWTSLTAIAESSGILERYRKIEELRWEMQFDSVDKIVGDHIRTLREVKN